MFSFFSSPFTVNMERIEKYAAEQYDKNFSFVTDDIAYMAERKNWDFDEVRTILRMTPNFLFMDYIKPLKHETDKIFYNFEIAYSKTCLELKKLDDIPLSSEELALPYMIIDFFRLAADRFANGNLSVLRKQTITFEQAIDFICTLDMPDILKDAIANFCTCRYIECQNIPEEASKNYAENLQKMFFESLAGGTDKLKIWKLKIDKPCYSCQQELAVMFELLQIFFTNLEEPDFSTVYNSPKQLEPPYTLDKLLDNLIFFECRFHDNMAIEKECASILPGTDTELSFFFAHHLRKLSEIKLDDPYRSIKLFLGLMRFYEFEVEPLRKNLRTGKYFAQNHREEYVQESPWSKPYFLWRDALLTGKNHEDCILPDALKCICDYDDAFERLYEEWENINDQEKKTFSPNAIPSLEELRDFFIKKEQSFKLFLQERCGDWEIFQHMTIYNTREIKDELQRTARFAKLFENGVPSQDAPFEEIGDYIHKHASEMNDYSLLLKRNHYLHNDNSSIITFFSSYAVEYFAEVMYLAPLEKRMLTEMKRIAADENRSVSLRLLLLERIDNLFKEITPKGNETSQNILNVFREKYAVKESADDFSHDIRKIMLLQDAEDSKRREELSEAVAAERKKVLFEMSHSIKNLVASVSEPLTMLQDELSGPQRKTIENALAGASLIRDLAVGIHMSMRGEVGAWRNDVLEPGFGATTLDCIILAALRHAVSNMFDGKYFAQFVKNYFGRDLDTFMQAQNDWKAADTAEETFACINKYFFDFTLESNGSNLKIPIGDKEGTATKLLILFQELFLNTVKYSSFTERNKRFVKVNIEITSDKWNITLSNSAAACKNVKSSGVGLAVIKNFATLFEADYVAKIENEQYITNIQFFLTK